MNRFSLHSLLFLLCLVLSPVVRGGLLYDNGAPDNLNGFEITRWIVADVFVVDGPSRLEAINFWTLEIGNDFEGSIVWQIYSRGNGVYPGSLLFTGTSNDVTHAATGLAPFGISEYKVTARISSVFLPPGSYWVALHNGPLSNVASQNVFWETTGQPGTSPSRSDIIPFLGNWATNGTPAELAFNVTGTPAPQIKTFADVNSPRVAFTTVTGANYRVEFRNDITQGDWTPLPGAENIAGTGSVIEVADQDANVASLLRRFYRVTLL